MLINTKLLCGMFRLNTKIKQNKNENKNKL